MSAKIPKYVYENDLVQNETFFPFWKHAPDNIAMRLQYKAHDKK